MLSFALLLTFSRGAFLGFLVVNALFVVWKFNMKKLGLALLGLAVAAALRPPDGLPAHQHGFDRAPTRCPRAASTASGCRCCPRPWRARSGATASTPIMWSDAMQTGAMAFVGHPHNAYLQAVLDMGLIGLALLLALLLARLEGLPRPR